MPLVLSSPTTINQTIDTIEINAFAVDLDGQAIHISYDEGYMDTSVSPAAFRPINRDKVLTLSGSDFLSAVQAADQKANAQVRPISVYTALKEALYAELSRVTGITGTVQ